MFYGPRSGRREAYAGFASELGVAAGHERGRFLVPRLDELDVAGGAVERTNDAVDPVTRIAIDATHAPCQQARDERVGYGVGHDVAAALGAGSEVCALLRHRSDFDSAAARLVDAFGWIHEQIPYHA